MILFLRPWRKESIIKDGSDELLKAFGDCAWLNVVAEVGWSNSS